MMVGKTERKKISVDAKLLIKHDLTEKRNLSEVYIGCTYKS